MKQYHDFLQHILDHGVIKGDRTGTGTKSVFGYQMRFDLSKGFPLVTTKKMFLRGVIEELLWFLRGDTNIKYLVDRDVNIWTPDAYRAYKRTECVEVGKQGLTLEEFTEKIKTDDDFAKVAGDLGPVYGEQWRRHKRPYAKQFGGLGYEEVDQLQEVINQIKTNPDSRRLLVSAWAVSQIDDMVLPPCHIMFQFYVSDGKLSCQIYQRSVDGFLGLPFNIASYALLTMMIADICGLGYGELIHTSGDAHIYLNHIDQVKEQLSREPYELPSMYIDFAVDIDDFTLDHFRLSDYQSHPVIKAPLST